MFFLKILGHHSIVRWLTFYYVTLGISNSFMVRIYIYIYILEGFFWPWQIVPSFRPMKFEGYTGKKVWRVGAGVGGGTSGFSVNYSCFSYRELRKSVLEKYHSLNNHIPVNPKKMPMYWENPPLTLKVPLNIFKKKAPVNLRKCIRTNICDFLVKNIREARTGAREPLRVPMKTSKKVILDASTKTSPWICQTHFP